MVCNRLLSAISGLPLINADGVKLKIDIQKATLQIKSDVSGSYRFNFTQPFLTDNYVILGSAVLSGTTVNVLQMDNYSNTHCLWYFETRVDNVERTMTMFNLAIGY